MRIWQVERRKRTRQLIELGGLVIKAGVVELTNDDRAVIYGALLSMADKLTSDRGEQLRKIWSTRGREAFIAELRKNQ
ncbi:MULTISPECIES: conjugal transfer protein TraD [unclassified Mesorhizobium]|uniref:conjugal transfer protein TraD n=1 Tax=unclassified Mesorhizobium TaxID=325217 RepID=UPI000FCB6F39|nr:MULTISPECIES: conjugal transfer protein TraD [unclassified Mesorhizobium]RUX32402.1 conjugal transfer protein TraD [Mesorhizobium sp. M2A.F.Ca.ET.042.01.1.1]TIV61328.1 MAG: conjugal transfer protein TraD [Mesorhizobium sp.]